MKLFIEGFIGGVITGNILITFWLAFKVGQHEQKLREPME